MNDFQETYNRVTFASVDSQNHSEYTDLQGINTFSCIMNLEFFQSCIEVSLGSTLKVYVAPLSLHIGHRGWWWSGRTLMAKSSA